MNIPLYDSPLLDTVLGALAHPKRRGIIHDLSLHPATVGQLAADHQLSLPAIHKHIRTLEEANLIVRKKVGRTNFVALKVGALVSAQAWIMQYRTGWGSDEATLDNYIARMRE
jgi:DNA-binding transcriptional ArsR family regulator